MYVKKKNTDKHCYHNNYHSFQKKKKTIIIIFVVLEGMKVCSVTKKGNPNYRDSPLRAERGGGSQKTEDKKKEKPTRQPG